MAVWLYHYLRSNREDQAWPCIAGVARETGLHRDTVIEARKFLFANGWLVKIGDTRFKTRRVAATFPDEQSQKSENPTNYDESQVGKSDPASRKFRPEKSEIPDTGKFRHEVDSSLEVDTSIEREEQTERHARSRYDSLQSKPERPDVEAAAARVEAHVLSCGVPVTAKVQEIIRRRIRQGVSPETLDCAVNRAMRSMPRDERKPQFYLGQNLNATVEHLLQDCDETELAELAGQANAMAAGHSPGELPRLPRPERPDPVQAHKREYPELPRYDR
jgi:hypothetical protein